MPKTRCKLLQSLKTKNCIDVTHTRCHFLWTMFSACTSIKVAVLLNKIADLPKKQSVLSTPFFTFSSFISGFCAAVIETCSYCRLVLAVSDSLWHHGWQPARPPYPSPTPGTCSNSCPLSWCCHPTISSSVIPFYRLQSFPASGAFPMSQFFASGGQSIGVSASTSVLPVNIQDWFPLGWIGWISLQSKGLSRIFSNTTVA